MNNELTNELDYKSIWEEAKKLVANKISAMTYDVWIKALEPIGVRGDSLILKSASAGAKSVVLKNHSEKIIEAIKECTQYLTNFEVVVEDETIVDAVLDSVYSCIYKACNTTYC